MATNDIQSTALSFAQYAVQSNDPLTQSIIFSLLDMGTAMTDIPFVNKATMVQNGVRFNGNLPTVNWVGLNSVPVGTIATPTPYQEQAFILRNNIDVDKYLVQDINAIGDVRGFQVAAYLRAQCYDFNTKFINNDHVTGDSNSFIGLKYRINNGSTYGVRAMNLIDAGGVDVRSSTVTTASTKDNGSVLVEYLDQLLWSVDAPNGDGVTLYMNEYMQRRLATVLRAMGTDGGFAITKDQFDRVVMQYKGAIIKDIGYQSDQQTRIIPGGNVPTSVQGSGLVGETSAGASGATTAGSIFTSIYAVNYSTDHFFGWQFDPIKATDLGLLNDGVLYRTVIDWAGGLINGSDRSLGRLFDIKVA